MRHWEKQLGLVVLQVFLSIIWGCGGIHNAARRGDTDEVKKMIAKGSDINAKDSGGLTPLMIAAGMNHIYLAKMLLDQGADVNAVDNDKKTALMYTIVWPSKESCGVEMANLLLDKKADAFARDKDATALQYALNRKEVECGRLVDLLIKRCVKVPTGFATLLFPAYAKAYPSGLDLAKFEPIKGGINLSPGDRTLTVTYYSGSKVWAKPIDMRIHVENGGIYILNYELDLKNEIWRVRIKKYE